MERSAGMPRESLASALELFRPLTAGDIPLYRQLYEEIRDAVLSGRLAAGTALPSSRELARQLGVGRSTVMLSYEMLIDEGYLDGRERSGTFVADISTDTVKRMAARSAGDAGRRHAVPPAPALGAGSGWFSARLFGPVTPFNPLLPAVDQFPLETWAKLGARRLRRLSPEMLYPGEPFGYLPLREEIADFVRATRGVVCEPGQVVIVAGTQLGLNLLASVLVTPGDAVWCEDPGDDDANRVFVKAGATIVPVPVDEEGLTVERGVALAPLARIAYVTPSQHESLGVTMSLSRRLQLLEWAQHTKAWVIEHDLGGLLRYRGRPIPSLQGLDRHGRTIYVGEFARLLFPSLRLSYLVIPESLVDAVLDARQHLDMQPPIFEQLILADFIAEGHLVRHIKRVRSACAERQATLIDACRQELGGFLEIVPRDSGMHLVGWLADDIDEAEAERQSAKAGLVVGTVGSNRTINRPGDRGGLVLGHAAFTPDEIREGARRLARALEAARRMHRK
jgi:GntR family transcriptional regulator/MocR family aminotransferase